MKKLLTLGLLLSALTASAAAEDVKATLQGAYNSLAKATIAKDTSGIKKVVKQWMAPDVVFIHKDGRKETATQMLAQMQQMMPMIQKFGKYSVVIEKLTTKGNTAEATVLNNVSMTMAGPDKKPHTIVDVERSKDSWVKVGGQWKLKVSKTYEVKATMDGQPLPG